MRTPSNIRNRGTAFALGLRIAAAFAILMECGAAPLFSVGGKAPQQAQLDAIRQRQDFQAMAVPANQAVVIDMDGVAPDRSEILIQNETTGKSLVLSGFPAQCDDFALTPLLIAEMKVVGLGEAESYRWSLLETAEDGGIKLVRSSGFQAPAGQIELPVFQYRAGDVVKPTDVTDRQLVAVGRMKPNIMVADPNDPAQQALAEAKAEELAYYAYTYELPDKSLCTYDEIHPQDDGFQKIIAGSSLTFDYTIAGTTSAAQTATTFGANLWGAQLSGTVPVTMGITFKDMGDPRIIGGSYSPSGYANGSIIYPSALRNQQVGYDISTSVTDIRLEFNSTFSFHFGTDPSACPTSQIDYITVLIHEMCHGLGFYSSIVSTTGGYGYGDGTLPLIYDTLLYYNGSRLTALSSSSRYSAIRSNALYWDGGNAKTAHGGSRIKMYAPTTYQSGSSVSHWDVNMSFDNWMEYAYQFPLHTFNTRKLGLMKDLGWTLASDSFSAPTGVAASDGTYSDKVRVTWNAVSGASHYRVSYSTSATGTKTALGSWQTSTAYDDTSASAGVTRYYWVQAATDSSGTGATGYSAYDAGWRSEASTTYPDSWDPGDNTAAGATPVTVSTSVGTHGPHGLAANDEYDCFKINLIAGNTYTFESSGSSDVYGELFNSTTLDTSSRVAYDDDGGDGTNFLLTYTPTVSGYHYLRVRAFTVGNTATYTLSHSYVAAQVAAPTGVAATDGTYADKVRVTWSAVSGASHYCVYRATSSTGTKTALNTVWQTATSYDDTTAVAGTTYYYWVKAGTSTSGAAASDYSAYDTGSRSASAKPDLIPYQPSAWDSKLVVSTVTGTTTSASTFLTTDTLYLDSAVLNDGSIEIPGPIQIWDIYVDGVLEVRVNQPENIPGGYYAYSLDWNLGSLAAGTHTIKIVADPDNVVDEANETNNEFTRTITVAAPAVALSFIAISGPATVNENGTASYTSTATYSDSTTANVTATATWSENSSYATIAGGVLTAASVSADQTVTVTASFTAGAVTKTATKTVTITNLTDPVTVSNLAFRQRPGTKIVDLTYDLTSPSAQSATVSLVVKNGTTPLATTSATGHIGANVTMGTGKAIVWNMAADWNGQVSSNISVTLSASTGSSGPVTLFQETFPTTTFSSANWAYVSNAAIDSLGISEPSASYSARLNGYPTGADEMRSVAINLSSAANVTLSYHYQRTGGGDSMEAGEDLILEYKNASGSWVELERQLGDGTDMTAYQQRTVTLPAGALHATFQFRFINVGTSSTTSYFDDWFVDDIQVAAAGSGSTGSISTIFAGGNGLDGNMFDLQVFGSTVTVNSLVIHPNGDSSGSSTLLVYYREGTYVGHEGDSSGWTLVSSTLVSDAVDGVPCAVDVTDFVLQANATYGIYVTFDSSGPGLSYTDGTNTYQNSHLKITTGTGNSYPFLDIYSPRTWNGTINYSFASSGTQPPSDMVLIPAGSFQMGDVLDGDTDALPVTVQVSAFYMAKHETTKELWDTVRTWGLANGYTDLRAGNGTSASKGANHPVHSITWYDMVKWCNARSQKEGLTPCYTAFGSFGTVVKTGTLTPDCNWNANGYRLPTEAEWEKAARGAVSGKRFPWGDTITHSQANYESISILNYDTSPTRGFHPTYDTGSFPYSSPVGSFAPNDYGLYDMAGNMVEWCWDWYGSYAAGSQTDPRGAASGSERVNRGGGWADFSAYFCRVADRDYNNPTSSYNVVGFRPARSSVP